MNKTRFISLTASLVLATTFTAVAASPPKAAEKTAEHKSELVPKGYRFFGEMYGDLNGDGKDDYVLIIKGTDKMNVRGINGLDRSRRGIMIFFNNGNNYQLAVDNRRCFSSEDEDGGNYSPPELSVSIKKGNLYIAYDHGRYGNWKYTFRYRNGNFELIGYDELGYITPIWVIDYQTSINFLTKKRQKKTNVNKEAEGGDEVFEETWSNIEVKKLLKLSEISDFDELSRSDIEQYIRTTTTTGDNR